MSNATVYHIPAMLSECIDGLKIKEDGIYIDATLGGAGHTKAILDKLSPIGRVYAFDQDINAIQQAPKDKRLFCIHHNFKYAHRFLNYLNIEADGLIADFGVSFHHFDNSNRGFSFQNDAPLDMRMDQDLDSNAIDLINQSLEIELFNIFKEYAEVKNPRKAASAIVNYRRHSPIKKSNDLNTALASCLPPKHDRKYLAKIYQALRISLNDEIMAIEELLNNCHTFLKCNARVVLLSYHSLEDRLAKKIAHNTNENQKTFEAINKKPLTPTQEEIGNNSRSRSAKLRVLEKKCFANDK